MFGKIRFFIAMCAAKSVRFVIRLLGRAASHTPGDIALRICPDFVSHLTMPSTVICITGTNGKTTTSNLVASVIADCGYTVTNNSYGSNINAGVTTALLADSTLTGKPKKQVAVLEVDERSSLLIYKYLTPDILICNNIMRDSLKRNAHTEFISFIINKALPASTEVVLNADDIICSRLAPANKSRTYFGVDAERPAAAPDRSTLDIVYCPECGAPLEADYIRYNHIGRVHCTACSFRSPEPDFVVTDIDREKAEFTVAHDGKSETFRLINDNIVNVYNFCGAVTVLTKFGLSYEQIRDSFLRQKIVKSRFDSIRAGKFNITMQLAKGQNPIACARAYSYIASCPAEHKSVIVMVDDKGDNTNNSESVCWLYDCDYKGLTDPSIDEIVFAGPRCRDHRARALLAGVDPAKIRITEAHDGGAAVADTEGHTDFFILFDPYLLAESETVKNALIAKGEAQK